VDPAKVADQVYEFLVGKPVFEEMNDLFENLAFTRIDLDT
jgi:iron complex transport system substrate-binding protein